MSYSRLKYNRFVGQIRKSTFERETVDSVEGLHVINNTSVEQDRIYFFDVSYKIILSCLLFVVKVVKKNNKTGEFEVIPFCNLDYAFESVKMKNKANSEYFRDVKPKFVSDFLYKKKFVCMNFRNTDLFGFNLTERQKRILYSCEQFPRKYRINKPTIIDDSFLEKFLSNRNCSYVILREWVKYVLSITPEQFIEVMLKDTTSEEFGFISLKSSIQRYKSNKNPNSKKKYVLEIINFFEVLFNQFDINFMEEMVIGNFFQKTKKGLEYSKKILEANHILNSLERKDFYPNFTMLNTYYFLTVDGIKRRALDVFRKMGLKLMQSGRTQKEFDMGLFGFIMKEFEFKIEENYSSLNPAVWLTKIDESGILNFDKIDKEKEKNKVFFKNLEKLNLKKVIGIWGDGMGRKVLGIEDLTNIYLMLIFPEEIANKIGWVKSNDNDLFLPIVITTRSDSKKSFDDLKNENCGFLEDWKDLKKENYVILRVDMKFYRALVGIDRTEEGCVCCGASRIEYNDRSKENVEKMRKLGEVMKYIKKIGEKCGFFSVYALDLDHGSGSFYKKNTKRTTNKNVKCCNFLANKIHQTCGVKVQFLEDEEKNKKLRRKRFKLRSLTNPECLACIYSLPKILTKKCVDQIFKSYRVRVSQYHVALWKLLNLLFSIFYTGLIPLSEKNNNEEDLPEDEKLNRKIKYVRKVCDDYLSCLTKCTTGGDLSDYEAAILDHADEIIKCLEGEVGIKWSSCTCEGGESLNCTSNQQLSKKSFKKGDQFHKDISIDIINDLKFPVGRTIKIPFTRRTFPHAELLSINTAIKVVPLSREVYEKEENIKSGVDYKRELNKQKILPAKYLYGNSSINKSKKKEIIMKMEEDLKGKSQEKHIEDCMDLSEDDQDSCNEIFYVDEKGCWFLYEKYETIVRERIDLRRKANEQERKRIKNKKKITIDRMKD